MQNGCTVFCSFCLETILLILDALIKQYAAVTMIIHFSGFSDAHGVAIVVVISVLYAVVLMLAIFFI